MRGVEEWRRERRDYSGNLEKCATTGSLYSTRSNRLPRDTPTTESYRRAGFAVGSAAHPEGPFEFAAEAAGAMPTMAHAGGADFSLLQDGADAYIAYGAWHNYKLTEGWRAEW